ncbi:MAG: lipopolysaccharide heptosyltransferase II [Candidatus Omnitrophica bacterium]|nr:lipopolysaccharide heptosyltransferase II [Candidatus Omnitrophota bacterium]MDD5042159.1 lipopolysaccharide heptosyltransferase II [Candidatus Omnitrophota bacterium]MDD5500188.1 lipopolysaccharide heptosyltransferase II [Candidatus Omnitrophota bacterium]
MKILFITLSNIGDCILTLPVLDTLREKYPGAEISCLVPERPSEIFSHNPQVKKVFLFDKHARFRDKVNLFFSLNRERFDIVIDLRNSMLGVLLSSKKKNSPLRFVPGRIKHMKDRHLFWSGSGCAGREEAGRQSVFISREDENYAMSVLEKSGLAGKGRLVVISPGARSYIKRWDRRKFAKLCRLILDEGWDVALVGDKSDKEACEYIHRETGGKAVDFCAMTSIGQLAALLKRSRLLITNDSAVMHLASYLDVPVAAVFGPTDESKYGPWSKNSMVFKKDISCRPCNKAACRFSTLACMSCVKAEEVFGRINDFLAGRENGVTPVAASPFRRMLITRTDRIGDVLLSTPAIKALRLKYPQAYIAMMVSPYARDIVEGNPYLDEVIIYDKDLKHRSWIRSFKFAGYLRKKKFDLAVILHPANRVHILAFLAGIPRRLGYDRKFGFLNNLKKAHTKQQGLKHEAEYSLELLETLGIKGRARDLYMPIREESERWAEKLLEDSGIKSTDKLLALNPGASCPSKIWPAERFAQVAEELARRHNFKVLVLSGPKDSSLAQEVCAKTGCGALDLSGRTSVSQMASVLKRCSLFISNDSGPVHIASALGTPVISIFGRNQPGLSPFRWGPLGEKDRYLHKNAGCVECLAHNCEKGFACLKMIGVKDVLSEAEKILAG